MLREGELYFDVAYPQRLSRLLIFVKWLLLLPHLLVLWVLQIVVSIVSFIAFFAILITGRYPKELWDISLSILRWHVRVSVYAALMRDEYPPFGDQSYPIRLEMVYPTRPSRWKIFVKWLLIIPHTVALWALGILSGLATVIAWFAILITGEYPRTLFDFNVGVLRWSTRVSIYVLLMSDVYPPFMLESTYVPPMPPAPPVVPVASYGV